MRPKPNHLLAIHNRCRHNLISRIPVTLVLRDADPLGKGNEGSGKEVDAGNQMNQVQSKYKKRRK